MDLPCTKENYDKLVEQDKIFENVTKSNELSNKNILITNSLPKKPEIDNINSNTNTTSTSMSNFIFKSNENNNSHVNIQNNSTTYDNNNISNNLLNNEVNMSNSPVNKSIIMNNKTMSSNSSIINISQSQNNIILCNNNENVEKTPSFAISKTEKKKKEKRINDDPFAMSEGMIDSDESEDESDEDDKIKNSNNNENGFPSLFPSQNNKLFNNLPNSNMFKNNNDNNSLFQTNPSLYKNEHLSLFKTDSSNSLFNNDNKSLFNTTNENPPSFSSNQTNTVLSKGNIEFSNSKSECIDLNKSPSGKKVINNNVKNDKFLNENKINKDNNPFLISN